MSMKHAALVLAALTLAPLAAQAQQNTNAAQVPVLTTLPAAPAPKGKQFDAPLTIKPVKASEKRQAGRSERPQHHRLQPRRARQGWHRDPGHFYDGRGVDCSAYPTRCR